jgi:hypothetical protein
MGPKESYQLQSCIYCFRIKSSIYELCHVGHQHLKLPLHENQMNVQHRAGRQQKLYLGKQELMKTKAVLIGTFLRTQIMYSMIPTKKVVNRKKMVPKNRTIRKFLSVAGQNLWPSCSYSVVSTTKSWFSLDRYTPMITHFYLLYNVLWSLMNALVLHEIHEGFPASCLQKLCGCTR